MLQFCSNDTGHATCDAGMFHSEFWDEARGLVADQDRALFQSLIGMVTGSRATGTWRTYAHPMQQFLAFCKAGKYTALPAQPLTVALFLTKVAETAESYAVVKTASAAIATQHEVAGFDSQPTKHPLCKAVRKAAKKAIGLRVQHRKEPLPAADVVSMVAALAPPGTPLLELMLALYASLCFAGFLRFSDAVRLRVRDIQFNTEGYVQLTLGQRKNDQFREGTTIKLAPGNTAACPVGLLRRFISESGWAADSLLFRKWDGHKARAGKPVVFMEEAVSYQQMHYHITKRLAAHFGVSEAQTQQQFGLHSLRSGGATAAFQAGVDPKLLQAHGGWRSEQVMQVLPQGEGGQAAVGL
jgi:integrase